MQHSTVSGSVAGPTSEALLSLTSAGLACIGGAILPWRRWRIGLLAVTGAASLMFGVLTFPSIGIGLVLAALLAGGALQVELSKATKVDVFVALAGTAAGVTVFFAAWTLAMNARGG